MSAFEAHGVRIAILTPDGATDARLAPILPPDRRSCPPEDVDESFSIVREENGGYSVLTAEGACCPAIDLPAALGVLDSQIRSAIAVRAPGRIFVHAGVVAVDDSAILIPGPSFSGKSTLVAALVERGAVYYSDEFAVLDPAGFVHPYARLLSLRASGGITACRQTAQLEGRTGAGALPLRAIVITSYRPGASWRPRQLTPGRGALALLENTVPARTRPSESLMAARRAAEKAVVLAGERGEAGAMAGALLACLNEFKAGGALPD